MKNISVHLQQFVSESLHPGRLSGQRLSASEFDKWKQYIDNEVRALKSSVFHHILKGRKYEDQLRLSLINEIIGLSNKVNGYLTKYAKLWGKHPSAKEIRHHYLLTCIAFQSLVDDLSKRYPNLASQLPISNYMLRQTKLELRSQLREVRKQLGSFPLDTSLITVATDCITLLINQQPLIRRDEVYLRKLLQSLVRKTFTSSDALLDHLIVNDLNLPEFFLFCVNIWSDKLMTIDGLTDQKEYLLQTKSHLFDLSLARGLKFPGTRHPLYQELNHFLSEKYAIVKERLKIFRQTLNANGISPQRKRILINLSVAQLGLFIRLQIEKGILAKEHVGELFHFFARHFYTPNTEFISAESLQKKSSDIEHATAVKLKSHLIAMLNWLNTHHNLSNYN